MSQNLGCRHIGIIMDGNGRWAQRRGLPRIEGHRAGAKNLRKITTHAARRGLEILTVYAFSRENWTRPAREIRMLMMLLKLYATRERAVMMKENIRLVVVGNLSGLPETARRELEKTIEITKDNTGLTLQLALDYGGRAEIVEAAKRIAKNYKSGEISLDDINEDLVSSLLWTRGQPDPDLIIRTSGEIRLSNFLLWQSAYAELYFTSKNWPEFSAADFDEALESFHGRERRFGGVVSKTP